MLVVAAAVYYLALLFLSPDKELEAIILIILSAVAGAGIYAYLGIKTRLIYFLFGDRVERILKKVKLRG